MNDAILFLAKLGIILVFAHGFGYFFDTFLKMPRILGEMLAGIIIGPSLLGKITLFGGVPLFTLQDISTTSFQSFIVLASVLLLFFAGLNTDFRLFIKFFLRGSFVGITGVIFGFIFATGTVVLFYPGGLHWFDPITLFLGISAATSVGISARVLSEHKKLDSPEGITGVTAAVVDDIAGVILLAIVLSVTLAAKAHTAINFSKVLVLMRNMVFFWALLTVLGILFCKYIAAAYLRILTPYSALAVSALGLALIMGGIAEEMGLSMVIGAYVCGLGLSLVDARMEIQERLTGVLALIVPVFFVYTGMMVDFVHIKGVIVFALLYVGFSLFGKFLGCASISLLLGFNIKGALRIGSIMLPRGEVTLIIASMGFAMGILTIEFFSVLALTVFISVLITPIILGITFRKETSGLRKPIVDKENIEVITLDMHSQLSAAYFRARVITAFQNEGFFSNPLDSRHRTSFRFQKENIVVNLHVHESIITISAKKQDMPLIKLLLVEELIDLQEQIKVLQNHKDIANKEERIEKRLLKGILD